MKKRALSPVITTVLLVLVAIILALLIWFWASRLVGEQLTKFSGTEERPVEELCGSVDFRASISGNQMVLSNEGNIPVYKAGILLLGEGSSKIIYYEANLGAGKSVSVTVTNPEKISKVIPVLLAKSEKDGSSHEYNCRDNAITPDRE